MESLYGHTWCNCLVCDERIEAFQLLIVGRGNRDNDLILALIHHAHTSDTSYVVFGKLYYLLNRHGEIQDPQLIDWDEDEDEDDEDWDEDERN